MLVNDVLEKLTRQRKSIAVVIDEYGGTSGIITVEDIVEELFGEIEDEHDNYDLHEKKISDNTKIFSLLPNIGDSKSLIINPASTTHSK